LSGSSFFLVSSSHFLCADPFDLLFSLFGSIYYVSSFQSLCNSIFFSICSYKDGGGRGDLWLTVLLKKVKNRRL
jgi:hypothetical protein